MENIIISNDGIYTREFNDNLGIWETTKISEELSYYYKDFVELDENLTFGGLFAQLEPYISKLEDHFMGDTRKWSLKPYFDWIKEDITEDLGFIQIQFSWVYQYYEFLDRKTGKTNKSLDEWVHLNALGNHDEHGICDYSISFTELNNLKMVPVKIIKECQISGVDRKSPILEFERDINLRDFIACLLKEITFNGSPERMREQLSVLNERCNESYDESELIPFKTIQLEWLEEELNDALGEEDYEWAERVRLEIEKVKKNDSEN
jgi:hypothetical protein